MSGVIWRGEEIEVAEIFVDGAAIDNVVIAGGEVGDFFSIAGVQVGVTPAIFFAEEEELGTVAKPDEALVFALAGIGPSGIGFGVDARGLIGLGIDEIERMLIAKAAEGFDEDFVIIAGPLHLSEVVAFRGLIDG